jgi:acyl-homoserine lactone acylase PvdQ
MLLAAPHRQFFGEDQFYEGHLRSDEGWRLWGVTFVGWPFPHLGFNEQLAWTHTVNTPDIGDLYIETLDGPAQPADYRYGDRVMSQNWAEPKARPITRAAIVVEQPTKTLTTGDLATAPR